MISKLVTFVMIAGALLLSACSSGVSNDPCFTQGCQAFGDHSPSKSTKMSFGGNGGLGSSFGEYGSGLLHDD